MDAAVYFYTLPAECVFLLLRDWQVVFSGFNGFSLEKHLSDTADAVTAVTDDDDDDDATGGWFD